MIFNSYQRPMDRGYTLAMPTPRPPVLEFAPLPPEELDVKAQAGGPIVGIRELGQSVPEGNRFGTFIQSFQSAIRMGVGTVELATSMGGGPEPVGAEGYGVEARQELRELAKINDVAIKSIHAPSNIGNVSGYNPQERGFSDEYRKTELEEVKKAIDFAADVAGQGAIVVHTGEFPRDMGDAPWNKRDEYGNYQFTSYEEEESRNVKYLVDERTGKLITEVRKSQVVRMPEFQMRENPAHGGRREYVDKDGNFLDETNPDELFKRVPIWSDEDFHFKTERLTWDYYVNKAQEWNEYFPKTEHGGGEWTPEEVFFRDQMNVRVLSARGSSLYHGREYPKLQESEQELKKALAFYQRIEKDLPPDRQWELMEKTFQDFSGYAGYEALHKYATARDKLPSEIIQKALEDVELQKRYIHEASASADATADESIETMHHVMPVEEYARLQTAKSYAEAGIHAMMQSLENKHAKGDLFIAPENIFPEMGFGSHPEELIELVQSGRQKMVEMLTEDYIEDPHVRRLTKEEAMGWNQQHPGMHRREGDIAFVPNPYKMEISRGEAEQRAERHIKATFDTQHLGMWWKNFAAKPGETVERRKERFNKWYMDQVDKLSKAGILGHLHIVDSAGSGHHHLPAGQGGLFPVVEAVKYLKEKGYAGSMVSEGYQEEQYAPGRILTETWRAFGNDVIRDAGLFTGGYGRPFAPTQWNTVQHSYFGQTQSPYFIFGAYAPSNDWSLWSQVPME